MERKDKDWGGAKQSKWDIVVGKRDNEGSYVRRDSAPQSKRQLL